MHLIKNCSRPIRSQEKEISIFYPECRRICEQTTNQRTQWRHEAGRESTSLAPKPGTSDSALVTHNVTTSRYLQLWLPQSPSLKESTKLPSLRAAGHSPRIGYLSSCDENPWPHGKMRDGYHRGATSTLCSRDLLLKNNNKNKKQKL